MTASGKVQKHEIVRSIQQHANDDMHRVER
jgi:hypothetical protein